MSFLDRVIDSYKLLDKNGLKSLVKLIKSHDYHWTGTHAEYEAQKDNIPAYAILHFTDDYDENVQVGVYSTEETKTGEIWIDGKPIYRKVYNVPNTSSTATWLQFPMNTPGFKEVVRWSGYSVAKAGHVHSGCQRLLGFAYYGGGEYMGGVTVYGPTHATVPNTIGVFEGSSLAAETDHYVITLEYTKTTD